MEKTVKHRFLNNALFTALIVPLAFFVLRDMIAVLTGMMFEAMGGKESFLYQCASGRISRTEYSSAFWFPVPLSGFFMRSM